VLNGFLGLVKEFGLKLQSTRHVALYLMACGYTGCWLLLGGCRGSGLGSILALLDATLLTCLELFLGDGFLKAAILRVGPIGERKVTSIYECLNVVIAHLILRAVTTDMVGDVGPRAQAVDLGALEQK
jgi:hypothetical protein